MIDVEEADALSGRTRETVRRRVSSDRLAADKRGRKLVVARADVMRLIEGGSDARPSRASDLEYRGVATSIRPTTWCATRRDAR
jgi:hypothetical protein